MHSFAPDLLNSLVGVGRRLQMEGVDVSSSLAHVIYPLLWVGNHHVHFEEYSGEFVTQ